MNAHEHTDPHGDGLTITHDDGKMWITCTTAHAEVTVGPLAPGILTDYDMDGGVAAALIEKEAEESAPSVDYHAMWWKAEREREKAEKERDEARHERDSWRAQVPLADWEKDLIQATENPRPLTPDAITDEMVDRAFRATIPHPAASVSEAVIREMLTAALTEPPARPEGAEGIDEHLRQANAAALGGALTPEQRRALADHLAGFGYRSPIGLTEDPR